MTAHEKTPALAEGEGEDYAPWRDSITGNRADSKRGEEWVYEPRGTFPPDPRDDHDRHTPTDPMEEMHREAVVRAVAAERERDEAREAATWATLAADTQRERANRLQAAIEEAPHADLCYYVQRQGDPCNCWKAGL